MFGPLRMNDAGKNTAKDIRMADLYTDYGYSDESECHVMPLLLPVVQSLMPQRPPQGRALDVGCGNGSLCGVLLRDGWDVVGIDLSQSGIDIARKTHPTARFEMLGADDQLLHHLNEQPFDVVISTEVVEHLYAPRAFIKGCFSALKPGGRFICTTPYHGYLKNLCISLAGTWDSHANPLWDGGHIKLWSRNTLGTLLAEAGFKNIRFRGIGRAPFLWKSMALSGEKPSGG